MKTLALLLFLAGGSAALADSDLLQNGDFSDGIAHWEGNCHSIGSSTDDGSATSGVVVQMRHNDWTKISQDFEGKAGVYVLTITYTATPDLTFSQLPADYTNVTMKMGLPGLSPLNAAPNEWCIMVVDTGVHRYHYWQLTPTLTSGVQTIKAKVELSSGDNFKKGFFLGFPPGEGSINLQSITLTPFAASTAAH